MRHAGVQKVGASRSIPAILRRKSTVVAVIQIKRKSKKNRPKAKKTAILMLIQRKRIPKRHQPIKKMMKRTAQNGKLVDLQTQAV